MSTGLRVGAGILGLALVACAPPAAQADGAARTSMKTAPMKANSSGVIVRFEVNGTPQAGKTVPIVLSFDGITDPAGATVRLTPDSGLSMAGGGLTQTLPAGQVTTLTVDVVAPASGVGYLHVFTTQRGASGVTSIPVQVGKASTVMPAGSDLKSAPDGGKILSMPVK